MKHLCFLAALVMASPAFAVAISMAPTSAAPGDPVTITVTGGQAPRDWVQIVEKTKPPDFLDPGWVYLSGTQTRPATSLGSATLHRTAPSIAGAYEARVYSNGSFVVVASAALQVANPGQCPAQCPAGPAGPAGPPGNSGQPGAAICDVPVPRQLGDTCFKYQFRSPTGPPEITHFYGAPKSPTDGSLIWWPGPSFTTQPNQ